MASTQVERKPGWQQEKYSLAEEKELGELDNVLAPLPLLLFVLTPLLNTFCCTFPPSFIKSPCLLYERSVILGFIFNNYSSFVNPSLHPILCGAVFIYVKLKKIKVSCHAVADKLLAE